MLPHCIWRLVLVPFKANKQKSLDINFWWNNLSTWCVLFFKNFLRLYNSLPKAQKLFSSGSFTAPKHSKYNSFNRHFHSIPQSLMVRHPIHCSLRTMMVTAVWSLSWTTNKTNILKCLCRMSFPVTSVYVKSPECRNIVY